MHLQNSFDGIVDVVRDHEFVLGVYASQHEYVVVLLDLAGYLGDEVLCTDVYLARCQRTGKCAGESATRRRDDVVDRRRMRIQVTLLDAVMLGNRSMNAEHDGLRFRREPSGPQLTTQPTNLYP